jgi:6-phospho-beta-glucosidase
MGTKRHIAVIGGGGFRTPRLLYGLMRHADALNLGAVALHDPDAGRVAVMTVMAEALRRLVGVDLPVYRAPSVDEAVADADYVLLTIRPGGEMGRIWDERVSLEAGVLGQETVGPGGFFLGLRTLDALADLLPQIRAVNRTAWVINFANPVGLVSEAVHRRGETRFIGVCDTPHHLRQELARYFGWPTEELVPEAVGLNHLGWFTALRHGDQDVLPDALARIDDVCRRVRPLSFFTRQEILAMEALPTEYVYLYLHAPAVLARLVPQQTRGIVVARQSAAFYDRAVALAERGEAEELLQWYLTTLVERSNSYLAVETAAPVARALTPDAVLASESYERVAIDTMLGLTGRGQGQKVVLNLPHGGVAASVLPPGTVAELTCIVEPEGPRPLPLTRAVPDMAAHWMQVVKRYELAVVKAVSSGEDDALVEALALNPLVPNRDVARRLINQRRAYPASSHQGSEAAAASRSGRRGSGTKGVPSVAENREGKFND